MTVPGAVALQVIWTRLVSVVEEQAQALIRTAFSTSVREAGDLSAGVYDAAGRMLAQAVTGTPGHVNAMADAVAHFIRRIGPMHEGDVYITNDPWEGTGHLHDLTVVTPAFHAGRLIGFLACTAHVTDIGGRGFGADADSVFEEGLRLPVMRLIDGRGNGAVDATLLALHEGLTAVITAQAPEAAAVEQTFVNRDGAGTLKLGQARGVALLAVAQAGIAPGEYMPNAVKKAVVGVGHAAKAQIGHMVRMQLPGADPDGPDAADALAIALCHAFHVQTAGRLAAALEAGR